jgi:hypothetical protein
MTDDHGLPLTERVDQRDHVADQFEHRVPADVGGALGAAEAAKVGRHHVVAGGGEFVELVAPAVGRLREAVQQHQFAVTLLGDVRAKATGIDFAIGENSHGRNVARSCGYTCR